MPRGRERIAGALAARRGIWGAGGWGKMGEVAACTRDPDGYTGAGGEAGAARETGEPGPAGPPPGKGPSPEGRFYGGRTAAEFPGALPQAPGPAGAGGVQPLRGAGRLRRGGAALAQPPGVPAGDRAAVH